MNIYQNKNCHEIPIKIPVKIHQKVNTTVLKL